MNSFNLIQNISRETRIKQCRCTTKLRLNAESKIWSHICTKVMDNNMNVSLVTRRSFKFCTADFVHKAFSIWNLKGSLAGGLDDIQNLINDVKSYAKRAYKFEDRVTDVLQRYLNRVINSVADNGLYKVLQPVMLYQGANGINRFATGATVAANSEIDLIPTTVTNELLAPVYKKFVAVVDKDGKSTSEIKTKGDEDFQKFTVKFGEAGSYTVVYAALDFYGNQIVKRYNVTVK